MNRCFKRLNCYIFCSWRNTKLFNQILCILADKFSLINAVHRKTNIYSTHHLIQFTNLSIFITIIRMMERRVKKFLLKAIYLYFLKDWYWQWIFQTYSHVNFKHKICAKTTIHVIHKYLSILEWINFLETVVPQ